MSRVRTITGHEDPNTIETGYLHLCRPQDRTAVRRLLNTAANAPFATKVYKAQTLRHPNGLDLICAFVDFDPNADPVLVEAERRRMRQATNSALESAFSVVGG